MLVAKMETLKSTLFDNISESTASRFAKFAEAEIKLTKERGARYSVKRIEEALDFCCDHPEAFSRYENISEARRRIVDDCRAKIIQS